MNDTLTQNLGFAHYWAQGDAVTHTVAYLLLIMSIASWYYILSKAWASWRIRQSSEAVERFWDAPSMDDAIAARDDFARWLADDLAVPSFLYGPGRTLPDIRRHAWTSYRPDFGSHHPHPTAGAVCVGAREQLVAYNCWLERGTDIRIARDIASRVRQPGIRSLGLQVGDRVQVSMNLVAPFSIGPHDAVRAVEDVCREVGTRIGHNELVGLVSERVLREIPRHEWTWLDLSEDRTIENRMAKRR